MSQKTYVYLCLLSICLSACHSPKHKNTTIDPDDTAKGRIVTQMYPDSSPRTVLIYEVDANGNKTKNLKREVHYYQNHKKYIEGNIKENQRDGLWHAYFKDGKLQAQATYKNGVEEGYKVVYRENGNKYYEGYFTNGICTGVWKFYTKDGKLNQSIEATDTSVVCGGCPKCKILKQNHH